MAKLDNTRIDKEVFQLYDRYAHNQLDRRGFVQQLSKYAVGGLTVSALLEHLLPRYEGTLQVATDDPRLDADTVEYTTPESGITIRGLLTRPVEAKEKLPGIIVVHENRGLNPYIEDVTRRAGLANFISLGPDALTPLGGYPGTDDAGRELQGKRDKADMIDDFVAAYAFLRHHPECTGRVGVVGFCFGGFISNMLAVRCPELGAAVPFYGTQPEADEVARINAPLLLHYAELDERVNAGWPAYEAALKANGKSYEAYVYPEVNHGFHNDTTPRYDEAAATLAWERTIAFFNTHLRS